MSDADYRVRTLLGSCMSITLWHPTRWIGGMSHVLLPGRREPKSKKIDGRYEVLVPLLLEMAQMSVGVAACRTKIFGGSDRLPRQFRATGISVGRKNGVAVRARQQCNGISTVSKSLLGVRHRQLIFDIDSDCLRSRQIPLIDASGRVRREAA